ncbi:hypothetical protein GUITHDRAFT_135866 [Guillardia theta CCMP2712]|uniref:Uncharacterized protein n=1 Tax=Guillardia theta (strain CCMP2712) TaxID=905079 RepID=L1JM72_GUITC|nr:hypothetical protein GUITHDRAFT_135866 [Guillardia theta CCMP2712]EKX49696.1 hypothetical protein GUITHDRAFT_135866 [Guillardia theta CCMP2712]|eukprot:XP_005836676.1 hypothetical protein GUITHDRAFT_135866 [Guillardia theta CCMP2712]
MSEVIVVVDSEEESTEEERDGEERGQEIQQDAELLARHKQRTDQVNSEVGERYEAEREKHCTWLQTKGIDKRQEPSRTSAQSIHPSWVPAAPCSVVVSPSRSIVEISDSDEGEDGMERMDEIELMPKRKDIENIYPVSMSDVNHQDTRVENASESLNSENAQGRRDGKARKEMSSEAQKRKQEKMEAKEEAKLAKEEAKRRKLQEKENLALSSGRKAMEHVRVLMDDRFVGYMRDNELQGMVERLESSNLICVKRTVFRHRGSELEEVEEVAPQRLLVYPARQLVQEVQSDYLVHNVAQLKEKARPSSQIILFIIGLETFLRSVKDRKKLRTSIEESLTMGWKVLKRIIEAIAEDPYKQPVPLLDRFKDQHSYVGNSSEVTPMQARSFCARGLRDEENSGVSAGDSGGRGETSGRHCKRTCKPAVVGTDALPMLEHLCEGGKEGWDPNEREDFPGILMLYKLLIFTCTEGSAIFDG